MWVTMVRQCWREEQVWGEGREGACKAKEQAVLPQVKAVSLDSVLWVKECFGKWNGGAICSLKKEVTSCI